MKIIFVKFKFLIWKGIFGGTLAQVEVEVGSIMVECLYVSPETRLFPTGSEKC